MSGGHLTPAVLIDLAEGTQSEDAFPHLGTCAHCRRQLTELRAALRMAASSTEVPEPSPLFWDHLSSRVREAVASELPHSSGFGEWISWKWAVPGTVVAAGLAAALFVYSTPQRSSMTMAPAGVPPSIENRGETQTSSEAPFSFVADLAEAVDWDSAGDAGLT